MKLADLIPPHIALENDCAIGFNLAVAAMVELTSFAESQGYRLVLAMPQHPITEDEE